MSLPKEPRQKMINMMYLVLTALLALNVSSEILNAFKTVNRSLETTNATVNVSTVNILKSLEDKTKKTETAERASKWYPKAIEIQKQTSELYSYIQGLKDEILIGAGGVPGDMTKSFKEDNLDIATRIMVEKGKGKELYKKLDEYKKKVLAVDPAIQAAFANSLQIDLTTPPTKNKGNNTWEAAYFRMVPTVAAMTILSKFQNDIKTSENKLVAFCHEQVGKVEIIFDAYAAIVGQNSNYLMPGQDIEIKAGIGAFSKQARPTITIGGSAITIGDEGYAVQKIPAGAMGNHSVPIRISYFNQITGKEEIVEKTVEYTVGQANASIALDKMNVLYINVDNPLSIAASGGGDDKIQVSISGGGGSITRVGNGKYNARVNSVTDDCRITVSVDGKVAGASQFRVRTIPDPAATVGAFPSGENVPAGAFKAQAGVSAWIKDFPFELKYTVQSFVVEADDPETGDIIEAPCTGNTWSPKAQSAINKLRSGSLITIRDIRAIGPDGRVRKLPGIYYNIR